MLTYKSDTPDAGWLWMFIPLHNKSTNSASPFPLSKLVEAVQMWGQNILFQRV